MSGCSYIAILTSRGLSPLGAGLSQQAQQIVSVSEVFKTSEIENPIHVCVQTSVAVGNNKRARLSLVTSL